MISLIKEYIRDHIRYLSTHRKRLSKLVLLGTMLSLAAILLDFVTSLPGTPYAYYFILSFVYIFVHSKSHEAPDQTPVALSIETSLLFISIISGLYVLLVYTSDITLFELVSQLILVCLYVSILMSIYFKGMFWMGSKINSLFSRIVPID